MAVIIFTVQLYDWTKIIMLNFTFKPISKESKHVLFHALLKMLVCRGLLFYFKLFAK